MNTKTVITALLAGIVAVVGAVLVVDKGPVITNVGALSGPDIPYQYLSVGGARVEYRSGVWVTSATTTPCTIEGPTASSTLIKYAAAGVRTDVALGDTTIDVGYHTTRFATSSVAAKNLSAGTAWVSGGSFELGNSGTSTAVVPPNHFIVMKLSTSTISTNFASTGTCNAMFLVN